MDMDTLNALGIDLCAFPAGAPPPGVTPNFVNPPTLAPTSIAICTIMMALAVVFAAGRLFANRKRLEWSDYCALLALILSLAHGALMLAQLKRARHQWDIPACWMLGEYGKLVFSQQMVFVPAYFFSKASILLLFYQLFDVERKTHYAIWAGMFVNFAICATSLGVEAYYQAPNPFNGETWDDVMITAKPHLATPWGIAQSVLSTVLDVLIFVLPIPVIARLNLSTRKRVKILAVFSTGILAIAANVVSIVFRVQIVDATDATWKLVIILLCTVVEVNIAIIVSSAPGFSRFIRLHLLEWGPVRSLRSRLSSSSYAQKSSPGGTLDGNSDSPNSSSIRKKHNKPRSGRFDRRRRRRHHDNTGSMIMLEDEEDRRGGGGAGAGKRGRYYIELNETWVGKSRNRSWLMKSQGTMFGGGGGGGGETQTETETEMEKQGGLGGGGGGAAAGRDLGNEELRVESPRIFRTVDVDVESIRRFPVAGQGAYVVPQTVVPESLSPPSSPAPAHASTTVRAGGNLGGWRS